MQYRVRLTQRDWISSAGEIILQIGGKNMKLFALTILSLLVTLTTLVESRKTYRGYRRVKS